MIVCLSELWQLRHDWTERPRSRLRKVGPPAERYRHYLLPPERQHIRPSAVSMVNEVIEHLFTKSVNGHRLVSDSRHQPNQKART